MSFIPRQGDAIPPDLMEATHIRTHPNRRTHPKLRFPLLSVTHSLAFKQLRKRERLPVLTSIRWWWWAHPAHLPELTFIYASLSWAYLAQRFLLLRDISEKKSNSLYSLGAYVCHYGQNNLAHICISLLSVPRLAFPSFRVVQFFILEYLIFLASSLISLSRIILWCCGHIMLLCVPNPTANHG